MYKPLKPLCLNKMGSGIINWQSLIIYQIEGISQLLCASSCYFAKKNMWEALLFRSDLPENCHLNVKIAKLDFFFKLPFVLKKRQFLAI